MADKNNYYLTRNQKNDEKVRELLFDLPAFCREFIYGTANNTSSLTRLNYVYDMRIFLNFISDMKGVQVKTMPVTLLDEITVYDIEGFLNYLSSYNFNGKHLSCNERGKARKLSTIRALFKYCFSRDLIKSNVTTKVSTPKLHEKEIIRLENDEVVKLLDYAESDTAYEGRKNAYHNKLKVRDFAILSLFLGTGIRISELVGLNVTDFDFENLSFVVTRKGGDRTILYYNEEVKIALQNWLDYRYNVLKVDDNDTAMFISLKNKRISTRAVQVLVKGYTQEITPLKKITPHKLRSTFGTGLYRQTGDIYAVADFLGHKDVNTTRRHYAAISQDSRRQSAEIVKLRKNNPDGNNQ